MDKKKVLLVLILSAVLAFIFAIQIMPKTDKSAKSISEDIFTQETKVPVQNTKETPQETVLSEPQEQVVQKDTSGLIVNDKSVEKVQVPENLQVENNLVKVEEAAVLFEDSGVINDNGAIVVTRPFKVQSPSKYSFVGYGVQKAPVK